jgi:hypothetical protein
MSNINEFVILVLPLSPSSEIFSAIFLVNEYWRGGGGGHCGGGGGGGGDGGGDGDGKLFVYMTPA